MPNLTQTYFFVIAIIAFAYFMSILYAYHKGNGLKKGSTLLAFTAIVLSVFPIAQNVTVKFFGAGELSFSAQEQSDKLETMALAGEGQTRALMAELASIKELETQNKKALGENKALLEELANKGKLSPQAIAGVYEKWSKESTQKQAPVVDYHISLTKLVIKGTCVGDNAKQGEFYYSLMINGALQKELAIHDAVSKGYDGEIDLSDSPGVTLSTNDANRKFYITGRVVERGRRSALSGFRKRYITTVGKVSEGINLNTNTNSINIGAELDKCGAVLYFSVDAS